jgi:hypothetical protein
MKTTNKISRAEFDKVVLDEMASPILIFNGPTPAMVNGVRRDPDSIEYPTRIQAENYAFWKITGCWAQNDFVIDFWNGLSSVRVDGITFIADVEMSKFM